MEGQKTRFLNEQCGFFHCLMKIKMRNITQVVNWHTGSTVFAISLSWILRILKRNDSRRNQPRLAACDLLKHKVVSPSSNSQWLCFHLAKGSMTQQPWPRDGPPLSMKNHVSPATSPTVLPQGFAGVPKGNSSVYLEEQNLQFWGMCTIPKMKSLSVQQITN